MAGQAPLSPDFRAWVDAGCQWPWAEDGQLAIAFRRLPPTTQRQLWHCLVERDDPAVMAAITGLDGRVVAERCDQAKHGLHQARTDLHLERLERLDCREVFKQLVQPPHAPLAKEALDHLRACPVCLGFYRDASRLDTQLEARLPVWLLGWWPGQNYLRAKAAVQVPLADPPFLVRLLERAQAEACPQRSAASVNVLRRSRATVAIIGFSVGIAVGLIALGGCDEQPGAHGLPSTSRSSFAPANWSSSGLGDTV